MYNFHRNTQAQPHENEWLDVKKPLLIERTIEDICKDIYMKGNMSPFSEIFDLLYEHIEDNIEKFIKD